jgi:hypothetical protein
MKYVKHNKVRLKTDKTREKASRVLLEFFKKIEKKPTGLKGFMCLARNPAKKDFMIRVTCCLF